VGTLTLANVEAAVELHSLAPAWHEADAALRQLARHLPSNHERTQVLLKASAVDKLYSTRAGNIYWVAEAVIDAMREQDRQLAAGEAMSEVDLVDLISACKQARYPDSRRCASFASKYCHFFVDAERFAIYDSFALAAVNDVLGAPQYGLTPARSEYRDFCERLTRLRARHGLEQVDVRELDRFLWLWGQYLAQEGNAKPVINVDIFELLFRASDPAVRRLVRALHPSK
jgi:hypothetical protein